MQRVIFLTAGAAGMYCGSCLHDNLLANEMIALGHDCVLQPVYTPIRTDVKSIARQQVFFGGIQIYLIDRFPWLAKVPRWFWKPLNSPSVIRFITRRASSTDAQSLGHLAVTMLIADQGPLVDEVVRLVDWIDSERPDKVILTNLLIGGFLPMLSHRLPSTERIVLLQGDDIFIDFLPSPYRERVIDRLKLLIKHVDRLIVNSQFYADLMSSLLGVPAHRFEIMPLSIDTSSFADIRPSRPNSDSFRIGYLARIAPEKGFDVLVDAFIELAKTDATIRLEAAGYLAKTNERYLQTQVDKIRDAGLSNRFRYWGEVSAMQKKEFFASIDVLSVPTRYHDPKGLFLLESMASGVPVVQPSHGAFTQLIHQTGGGLLYRSVDNATEPKIASSNELTNQLSNERSNELTIEDSLVSAMRRIRADALLRQQLSQAGRSHVLAHHDIRSAAIAILGPGKTLRN
jgi:glycosyltransferase involved in cell wall biosynthesis